MVLSRGSTSVRNHFQLLKLPMLLFPNDVAFYIKTEIDMMIYRTEALCNPESRSEFAENTNSANYFIGPTEAGECGKI